MRWARGVAVGLPRLVAVRRLRSPVRFTAHPHASNWASISTPSALTIRYQRAVRADHASTSATISSFPIHQPDQAVQELSVGALIGGIRTSHRRASAARYLPPRPPNHLGLTHFQPSYELFGAAYRIAFHDRGHGVVVYVALGSQASSTTRQNAIAIINSIRAQRRSCSQPPVTPSGDSAPRDRPAPRQHPGRLPQLGADVQHNDEQSRPPPGSPANFDVEGPVPGDHRLSLPSTDHLPRGAIRERVKLGSGPWVWYSADHQELHTTGNRPHRRPVAIAPFEVGAVEPFAWRVNVAMGALGERSSGRCFLPVGHRRSDSLAPLALAFAIPGVRRDRRAISARLRRS